MSLTIYDEKWGNIATEVLNNMLKSNCPNLEQLKVDIKYVGNSINSHKDTYVRIYALTKKGFNKEDSNCIDNLLNDAKNYLKLVAPIFERIYVGKTIITVEGYNKMIEDEKKRYETYYKNQEVLDELKSFVNEEVVSVLKDFNKNIISEASKKNTLINKIGLSEDNAEILDRLCGSFSVWMANKLIEWRMKTLNDTAGSTSLVVSKKGAVQSLNHSHSLIRGKSQTIQSIMDYIRVGLNGDNSSIKDMNFTDLSVAALEWHESLDVGQGEINYVEANKVVLDFRNEDGIGFYWVDLQTSNSNEECKRMGHCGKTGSNNILYSLRQTLKIPGTKYTLNKSHLTASIGRDSILYQLKGPKNAKPKEEFHTYILPLFYLKDEDGEYLIQGFGSEYAANQDFKLTDLPNDVIVNLYQNRPDLFDTRSLKKKLIQLGVVEAPNIDYHITLDISPDRIGEYVSGDYVISRRKVKKTTPAGQQYERTIETWLFETILGGDTWDLWNNYDADWEGAMRYYVDKTNEQKIREILKYVASKDNPDFDVEEFEEQDTDELIRDYDDDHQIRGAINNAVNNAEESDYHNHLWKTLKDCLEEYGNVTKFNDTGVTIEVDAEKYIDELNEEWLDDYMERCDDDIECVFQEMIGQGDIDKPRFSVDDRWTPDVNEGDFNEMLKDYLSDIS